MKELYARDSSAQKMTDDKVRTPFTTAQCEDIVLKLNHPTKY